MNERIEDPDAWLAAKANTTVDELRARAADDGSRRRAYRAVPWSSELDRILALPRRDPDEGVDELTALLTDAFRTPWGGQTLRPRQALALAELYTCRGLLANIVAGGGKTLITYLGPVVLGAKRPLLIVPKNLEEETRHKFAALAKDWMGPDLEAYKIVGYEWLYNKRQGRIWDGDKVVQEDFLTRYAPDAVFLDEADAAKSPKAVVRKRLHRYKKKTGTPYAALSATFATMGIVDYAHISWWCLGLGTPIPDPDHVLALDDWSMALDNEVPERLRAGELLQLCQPAEVAAIRDEQDELRIVRVGYQRRLNETPGVILSPDEKLDGVALTLEPLDPGVGDPAVAAQFLELRTEGTLYNVLAADAKDAWRHARELTLGVHYYPDPPPPVDWLETRAAWGKWVRHVLSHNQLQIESEGQLKDAIRVGRVKDGGLLAEWEAVAPTFTLVTRPAWHSTEALDAAATWLAGHPRGVVWVEHVLFAERLAELTGVPYFADQGKDKDGRFILDHKGPCIASVSANHKGRNMQFNWAETLIMTFPQSPKRTEQMLARVHRPGQAAAEVRNWVWVGSVDVLEGIEKCKVNAEGIALREGGAQRVLYARSSLPTILNVMRRGGARWVK